MGNEQDIYIERIEEELRHREQQKGRSTIWIFIPAGIVLIVQIWKILFIAEILPGIHWLCVLFDSGYLVTFVLSGAGIVIFFLIGAVRKILSKETALYFSLAIASLLLALSHFFMLPLEFAQHTVHLKSVRANFLVYHLSGYPMFDVNYEIAQCEPLGLICRNIYRSYDITDIDWREPNFSFDPATDILTLSLPEEGILFAEEVP